MHSLLPASLFLLLLSLSRIVSGQFGFFDQMFGHSGQYHQQQQRQGGPSQWVAQADSVPCSQYLCPDTLLCVAAPTECPCPNVQQVKCLIPDGIEEGSATVACVSGEDACERVLTLAS